MSEKPLPFVITDRRKFTSDGQPREGAEPHEPEVGAAPEPTPAPKVVEMPAPAVEPPAPEQDAAAAGEAAEDDQPAGPTAEQMEQSLRAFNATAERLDLAIRAANPGADHPPAFNATAERLDLAIRAANPGAEHPPALTFESLIQSIYMQAVMQLGGGTQPGEQPQVDILGARQSIEMLGLLAQRTEGNLTKSEDTLLASALFELRLAFLELTQALARSSQQRNPVAPGGSAPAPGRPGPSLIR
jgi:hypothetical protein